MLVRPQPPDLVALVVKRTSWLPPKEQVQVRFLAGVLLKTDVLGVCRRHATLRRSDIVSHPPSEYNGCMETKKCSKCQDWLTSDQYNWKNRARGIRYTRCKKCWNEQNKIRYETNKRYYVEKAQRSKEKIRRWLMTLKAERGCSSCKESHPACLHFHHLDPELKLFEIGDATLSRSKETIEIEISKCIVLCSNCHSKFHFKQRGGVWPLPPECEGFARSPAEAEEEARLL
jgi:hypothetical protein